MALIKADRVKETSTSTGTGVFTLAGAATGFRRFSAVCAVNDTVYYVIDSDSGTEWETGLGTYSATNTLTRTTVHASSNANAAVNFSAGTKNVYISQTARQINTISAAPPATTGAPARLEDLTGAAHTALTASTEYSDVYWNLARTVQFSTGAIATQRAVRVAAPTYSFVGASTITDAATFQVDGGPVAGTNATLTNSYAMRVLTGQAASIGISIQSSTSQSANIFEWKNSAGKILGAIESNGSFVPYGGNGSILAGNSNVAIGASALISSNSPFAFSNTAVGNYALTALTSGANNVAVGSQSLAALTTGGNNVAIGANSLNANNSYYSVAVGDSASQYSTGSTNTAIGAFAGQTTTASANITGNSNCVYIGYSSQGGSATETNAIVIGASAQGKGSNTTVIGTTSTTETTIYGAIALNGAIKPATLTNAAAPNNSIYYSSTAGKLVYKDSAGTVNNLY